MNVWIRIGPNNYPTSNVPVLAWGPGIEFPFSVYRNNENTTWYYYAHRYDKDPLASNYMFTHWMHIPKGLESRVDPKTGITYFNQNPVPFISEKEIVAANVMGKSEGAQFSIEPKSIHSFRSIDTHLYQATNGVVPEGSKCVMCGTALGSSASIMKCPGPLDEKTKSEGTMKNELHHEWVSDGFFLAKCKRCRIRKSATAIGVCPGFITEDDAKAEDKAEGSQPIGTINLITKHSFSVANDRSVKCMNCGMPFDQELADSHCPGLRGNPSALKGGGGNSFAGTRITDGIKFRFSQQQDPNSYDVIGGYQTTGYIQSTGTSNEEMRRIRQAALDLAVRSMKPAAIAATSERLALGGSIIELAHDERYILSVAKTFEAYLKNGTLPGNLPEENSK
jgi:hypothetical protein